jgi:curved DNA-binding protein CbpA
LVTPDYYALLAVAPDAEHEIIRAAYLVLAKRYHPDAATAASPHDVEKFQLITEAYEVLRDPNRRAQYDKYHARQKRLSAQREKFEQARRRAREQAQRNQGERSQEEQEHREARARALRNPLVFSVGGFALAALVFGLIKAPGLDNLAANTDPAMHTEKFEQSSSLLGDKAAQNQELPDVQRALQRERDKSEKLAHELATAWRELQSQAAALADNAAQHQELTDLRQAQQQTERLAATYQELLVQERARNLGLEEQLAARQDATPARGHNAMASLSQTPDPTPAPATDKPATVPLPASDKSMTPAGDRPATITARSTAPEARVTAPEAQPTAPETPKAPGDPEPARLMARASLLLGQGNIGVARVVLERAAEMGSAPALFALAETYDPAVLSAWGTFGTQGDVGKAQELYAKAFAGGVQEARDRLNASRW